MSNDIGWARKELLSGKKVCRAGWNGKGMFLLFIGHDDWGIDSEHFVEGSYPNLLPWIGMKTADGCFMPWLCSQTDLLATDWEHAK